MWSTDLSVQQMFQNVEIDLEPRNMVAGMIVFVWAAPH